MLGPDSVVLSGPADKVAYSYDAAGVRALPELVVLPADTTDTAAVVRWAARRGLPVVARGAGTNLSGGTVPVAGGVVVELSRLDRIIAVDTRSRRATVGPGLTNLALQNHLAPLGYNFAPDPASQKVSTIGGNVGENAGGPHCLKYGVTVDHILGLTAVLSDGQIVQLGHGDGLEPGLNAVSAMSGSEGTLALFTEVVVRLETAPPAVQTLLVLYDRLEDAGRSVSEIIARRILPATLELMDRTTLQSIEESLQLGYPTDVEGALLIEVDGLAPGLSRQVALIEQICLTNGARSVAAAKDERERGRLWQGRRAAFGALARRSPIYSVQDATVPRNKLVEMMRIVQEVCAGHDLPVAIVAHAGDGNLHPIILYGEATPERLAVVHDANQEILRRAADMGGTISGEHGVGLEKLEFLSLAVDRPTLGLMHRVKNAFDPDERLNPGKAIPAIPVLAPAPADVTAQTGMTPLAAKVAAAAAAGDYLLPGAAGTRSAWSQGPRVESAILRLAASPERIELDTENLTVTVSASTSSERLREALAVDGFWLPPLDHGWHGSVGGDVATNQFAPTAATLGPIARWLLGARLVTGDGLEVRLGGQTMKNVAGYNLLHLLAGSFGRLGAITELTLRLWPRPEADLTLGCRLDEWLAAGGSKTDALGPWEELVGLTRPAALAAISQRDGDAQVLLRLAGLDEDVAWAAEQWHQATPLRALSATQQAERWGRWSEPLVEAAKGGCLERLQARPARSVQLLSYLAQGSGAWATCLISESAWRGVDADGDQGAQAEGLTVLDYRRGKGAGMGHGPLDERLRVAFDPHRVFAGPGGAAR